MNFPDIKSAAKHAAMPDIQSSSDHRNLAINQVGVRGVRYPVLILLEGGGSMPSVGEFGLSVGLAAEQKGTHMSRFIELLEAANQNGIVLSRKGMQALLEDMLRRLDAATGLIDVSMPFFINKSAPVSGVQSMMDYRLRFIAEKTQEKLAITCEVKVPVKSLCPCSKEISEYGAHNQRSEVMVRAQVGPDADWSVEQMIRTIESQASCELWGLLKRPDEKYVTEKAYDNPKFVEDLVRDVAQTVGAMPGVLGYEVEAENFESIHNHSAWARIVSN